MNKQIGVVFGTRPELIKLAPVIQEFSLKREMNFQVVSVSSGQHRQLLEDALSAFEIEIGINLGLMKDNQTSLEFMSRALESFQRVFEKYKFAMVLVHGDTGTAAAAAIAAHHLQIPVAHVEAGLRSFDIWAPWPEESNRRIIDALSSLHFAPTMRALENLYAEGFRNSSIMTGNTVVDSVIRIEKSLRDRSISPSKEIKSVVDQRNRKRILVTQHRRESFGDPLLRILDAVEKLADSNQVIFPVHPNPNVKDVVWNRLGNFENVVLIPPLKYIDLIYVLMNCDLVITDSGGLQEEAPSLNVPVLVTRDKTERPEGIDLGFAKLVGTDSTRIILEATKVLAGQCMQEEFSTLQNPYGDGKASQRIVEKVISFLEENRLHY